MLLRVLFGAIATMGVYCNIALQNRTAFLAFGVALASGAAAFLRSPSATARHRVARVLAVGVAFAIGLFVLWHTIADMPLFQRFETDGLDTARYELWLTVLRGLPTHPWGGRAIRITEHYAHNLWLDVGWDAGIVPAALLVVFHALHLRPATQLVRSIDSLNVRLIFICVGISFLFTAMAEPVLALPIAYFGATCYYFGVVLGLRDRLICSRPHRGPLPHRVSTG